MKADITIESVSAIIQDKWNSYYYDSFDVITLLDCMWHLAHHSTKYCPENERRQLLEDIEFLIEIETEKANKSKESMLLRKQAG
jgi:hypothetical protein